MTRRDTWHHSNVPEPSLNPPEPPICRAMYRTGDESPEWFRGRWRRCTEYMPCPIHPIHDDDESSIGTTTIPRVTQGKRKTKMVKAKFTVTEVTHMDPNVPKNEQEWWTAREIARLTADLAEKDAALYEYESEVLAAGCGTVKQIAAERDAAIAAKEEIGQRKDDAYEERNRVVAALARLALASGYRVVRTRTAIEGWSEDWHGCVYINLPCGQSSWHFHDSQAWLFADLPEGGETWDGHTTEQKYDRLHNWRPQPGDLRAKLDAAEKVIAEIDAAQDYHTRECVLMDRCGNPGVYLDGTPLVCPVCIASAYLSAKEEK